LISLGNGETLSGPFYEYETVLFDRFQNHNGRETGKDILCPHVLENIFYGIFQNFRKLKLEKILVGQKFSALL
jgi:hypothetical protein